MPRFNSVEIRATYDQTLGDTYNIEDFTPSSGSTFNLPGIGSVYFAVGAHPVYSEGQQRIDASAGESFAGYEQVRYTQPMCHVDSYSWLKSNYRGQVTAYLRTDGTTYARYNCNLRFEMSTIETRPDWVSVEWIFTLIEAL